MDGGGGRDDRIEGDGWRKLEGVSGFNDRRWGRRQWAGNMNGSRWIKGTCGEEAMCDPIKCNERQFLEVDPMVKLGYAIVWPLTEASSGR